MFPKFLKIAVSSGRKTPIRMNETHSTEKIILSFIDQNQLDMFAGALGFSYEVVVPPEQQIGQRLPNGFRTGALGMLQRREVDMVVDNLFIDGVLHEEFRLTYPVNTHEGTFIANKPEPMPVEAYFLHPFSIQVWLAVIACIFLMSFIFHRLLRRKHSIVRLFTSILGSLVGQGIGITPLRRRDYFVLASWFLSCAFLYYFYAAVLLSFLTFPPLHGIRTIDDFVDGIKSGAYECSTYAYWHPMMWFIHLSDNPTVKIIVNNLDPQRFSYDHPVDYMETFAGDKKPAFLASREDLMSFKDAYFISEENFFVVNTAYATNKEFCCGSELDKVIHRAWASGMIQKYAYDFNYMSFTMKRKSYEKLWGETPPAVSQLTMTQLKRLFIFLIASHTLASFVFLIEVFTKKDVVFISKSKVSGRHRQWGTKRKKRRSKNSLSIANFSDPRSLKKYSA